MKRFLFVITLLIYSQLAFTQSSFSEFNLSYGSYEVGFKNYDSKDLSRTYTKSMEWNDQPEYRPMSISIWYPAINTKNLEKVKVLDYLKIYSKEKEWEHLPEEELLSWYVYPNTEKNRKSVQENTKAYSKASVAKGTFPAVIYAPSYEASSIENFALAEYLASHGYVVISSPSLGYDNQYFGKNLEGALQAQTRDLEFLLQELLKLPFVDSNQIATAAFSFGGLSNVLLQSRNDFVKATLSLDGTIRYNYPLLKKIHEFSVDKVDVPFLHMAQKVIPEAIMKRQNMDAKLNTEFLFYDELTDSDGYKLRFHDLTHMNFSSFDVVLRNRDQEQDKSEEKILQSYRSVAEYSLQFLNAYLKEDSKALSFLRSEKFPDFISKEFKIAEKKVLTFSEFHGMIKKQGYKNIESLYKKIKKEQPTFKINEGWLNQLGLQLIFNKETAEAGIAMYNFALSLFPNSANLYDSLATGFFYLDRKEEAIQNFKKSLELYPQNQHAKDKLLLLNKN